MGIYESDAFHWENLLFLVATLQLAISSCGFIILSLAENRAENAFAFYQAISALAVEFCIAIVIWKKRDAFELIHSFESFIDKSELSIFFVLVLPLLTIFFYNCFCILIGSQTKLLKIRYGKMMAKIEWMSELFHTILIKFTFSVCNLPAFPINLFNYYALDLGAESLSLQNPTMCVKSKFSIKFHYRKTMNIFLAFLVGYQ